MSQEPEDIEKEDPSKQEENVIDLTTDDENEVEMEEVPAVDLQVIYDAPSSVVADVLQNLMDSEEAEKENENENIEEILIDDDEEDEILHVEDTIRTDEQKLEIRKEKLDEFLSWFIRLKREQFTEPKINSPDYLTTIVEDEPIFDSDVAKLAMEKYKSLGTTDGLAEALELENLELALTAVCIGVLGADNELDIDFAPLCWDRVDEWTINRITRFLDLPISGLNARAGPLKLMKFCLTTPAQTIIALTIVWLKDQNHPLTLNFEDGDGTDFGPLRVNPWGLSRVIVDTAIRYWHERPHRNEEDAMSRELDEFFHELETTSAEIETNLERINTEKNEILQRGIEADKDYEDVDISELKFLDPRRKEDIERAKRKLEVLTADIKRITEAADECYKKKGQFMQMLVLNVGDWCLARNAGIDEKELMFAQIEAHVDSVTYRVKFCDTRQVCNVNIRDIAVTNFGMHHPIFDAIGDIGLRVAICQTPNNAPYSKRVSWFSGTTAGRRHAHKGDFLVFLDNGTDCYVTVPSHPTDEGYAQAIQPSENLKLHEVREKMYAAQMAVMLGQPLTSEGLLDRNRTCQWIRHPAKANYIREFMKEFPEWQLLRMPVGMRINVFQSLTEKKKSPVVVVGQDRVFAIVRYEVANRNFPGFDCLDYPCLKMHRHRDERIYRGSHRLEGAAHKKQMLLTNNNLSSRCKNNFASQFEPTEMSRNMPVRNAQQPLTRRTDSEVVLIEHMDRMAASEIEERRRKQNLMTIVVNKTPEFPPLEELKVHEQCGPDCLRGMDSDPYDSKFHHCSPLHSPLMCGWRRKKVTMKGGKRRSPWKKVIIYFAPCGKPLYEMPEVGEYLRETRSMFTIDCFTFSEEVNTEIYISVTDKKYVKVDDFSGGVEGIPIPLVNTVDDEAPPKMEYSKRRFQFDQTVSLGSINRDFCSGCSCEGDCSDATKCECQQLTMQSIARLPKHLQYNGKEKMIPLYENRVLHNKVISGMYECNDQCSCHRKACHNRVVQNNIKYPMQIFKTAQSGWGVRALTDIPSGSFICNYVGALLTNDLADQLKNDDQYFADLDLKDSVETHKMMENDPDIDADYGYGGDSEYNSEEEREHVDGDGEDSADDARDKTVVMKSTNKNGSSSMVETRQTRRKEQEEKDKEEKGDDGEEDDEEDGEESKKEQVEEVFNWDAYFKDSALFVVDAKQRGNLGRFLNHSCEPNVQVQHVLYDTHDLRLPWVAFFTTKPVKAGDELCWDYAYTVLNPDVERLSCHCGAKTCRRRLL